ncbi:MAG TPA: L,D-transpeptidase family protein [Blastocatellia bacterium]|nr:L,D-transpeptidase family protein [Blastocatellia bacterium]HMX28728.1 L,D-transpeptidase family protein [Blastocatellia bacterium]HMZ22076.1 L,D-transpeptidase family protein [Blastocatellia bacterium]
MKTLLRIIAFLAVVAALVVGGLVLTGRKDLLLGEETAVVKPSPLPTVIPATTPSPVIKMAPLPVTMPMLDALLQLDERFPQELKTRAQLTDEQIVRLKTLASEETGKLRGDESGEVTSTSAAGELATERLKELLGAEKARLVSDLTMERLRAGIDENLALVSPSPSPSGAETPLPMPSTTPVEVSIPLPSPSPTASPTPASAPATSRAYNSPPDTRIVVNAPAHRLDVFQNGQLLKSYKIGIGYPEFPLPDGERKASSIIFNPTWTPPDEPWVESSNKVKVGQRVSAGDPLNPLGVIKIPIGLPSLIHGGKAPAKIGGFASHGCVGMTNKQVQEFTKYLAEIGGTELTEAQIADYAKTPTQTKVVKLKQTVPVEFRYETIVVGDGELHIYRDVYDRDTNTEANLRAVLEANGVTMNDLTEKEKAEALQMLNLMSAHPSGKTADANLTAAEKKARAAKNIEAQQLTASVKGKKEVVIPIAALAGKGYPAPVDLNTGGAPPAKPKAAPAKKK